MGDSPSTGARLAYGQSSMTATVHLFAGRAL